ncbi:alanyl-tRNA editing protein [Sedimenticola selenatireducens]|uniref:Alanyl-tRNA editing protein n=1 Tax=Sedimenticola selenatireducens TaxID=191960 RepID=A0A2N6CU31_9GAMM|nr:alanyl-tRNA editing protein [Sedimenticola selenatireducens]PLX60674.1 MAG: alanyl-tRNA editing protein [Sedimenticola selenatireducens]
MVEKVFWQDPYLSRLEATIASVSDNDITLDRTIFYAFSGGQESDRGSIGNCPVVTASKRGHEIIYTLEPGHPLKPGDRVVVEIDWLRRYRLMRLHFACELVLELVYRALPGIEKIGANIAEEKARIDFLYSESLGGLLPKLMAQVNAIAEQDLVITSDYSDPTKEKRYWAIEGFSRVPCGGTHLKRTGEIGAVTLKRKNPGKGKERIEIRVE